MFDPVKEWSFFGFFKSIYYYFIVGVNDFENLLLNEIICGQKSEQPQKTSF